MRANLQKVAGSVSNPIIQPDYEGTTEGRLKKGLRTGMQALKQVKPADIGPRVSSRVTKGKNRRTAAPKPMPALIPIRQMPALIPIRPMPALIPIEPKLIFPEVAPVSGKVTRPQREKKKPPRYLK